MSFLIIFYMQSVDSTDFLECPVWIVLVLSSAYLFLYYILYGRRVRRDKVKFLDLIQEESKKDFPEEMEKKFEKAKKKNLKKGKGELTLGEFLDKEEKECGKIENLKLFYIFLPIAVTAVVFALTFFTDGFDSGADMLIFVVIMLVVECSLMRALWKLSSFGVEERREWIEMKRKDL